MSTQTKTRGKRATTWWVLRLLVAVVILGIGFVLLQRGKNTETALGFLTGGLFVLVLALISRWAISRFPQASTPFARLGAGKADERDKKVMTKAMAITGSVAIVVLALALVATGAGIDAETVLRAAYFTVFGALIVSFAVINRRM